MARSSVLVVDDEPALAAPLRQNLEREGFAVNAVRDGDEAVLRLRRHQPEAILLDWTPQRLPGPDLCRQIRRAPAWRDIPVIALRELGDDRREPLRFDSGAEDFVVKPFSPSKPIARPHAVILRRRSNAPRTPRFGDVSKDLSFQRVTRDNTRVPLRPIAFCPLRFLLERPCRVFSRGQLVEAVWGLCAALAPRSVDVHLWRLRKALPASSHPDLIPKGRSTGYLLDPVIERSS